MNQMKKALSGVLAVLCTASFAGSAMTASAVSAQPEELFPSANASFGKTLPDVAVRRAHAPAPEKPASLPSSYDLRNVGGMNFVTPVKNQAPWGTCWSFGANAAVEISTLSKLWREKGITPEEAGIDLAERHTAWFYNTQLPADNELYPSQAGEGQYATEYAYNPMNTGGSYLSAVQLFTSGIGPVNESEVPYRNEEGTWLWIRYREAVDENGDPVLDEDGNPVMDYEYLSVPFDFDPSGLDDGYEYEFQGCYSIDGDWSVPEEKRFNFDNKIGNVTVLPSPALMDESFMYAGYDANATTEIKKALISGHGVSVCYYADSARFDELNTEGMFINDKFAHYTYIPNTGSNHCVCIVGYDDNYSRENFLQGIDEETGLDRAPEGDGAWIVKNSWGAVDNELPNKENWGVDGSGYFYLSYYDKSIIAPMIIEVEADGHDMNQAGLTGLGIDQIDLMPARDYQAIYDPDEIIMANTFTAAHNEKIYELGVYVNDFDTDVELSVFELDENTTVPTAGKLLGQVSAHHDLFGYYREKLETPIEIPAGTRYAIVATEKNDGEYLACSSYNYNEKIYEYFEHEMDLTPEDIMMSCFGKAVVNRGESALYYQGEWFDLVDIIDEMNDEPYFDYENLDENGNPTITGYCENLVEIDNFPLKAYVEIYDETQPEETTTAPAETTTTAAETTTTEAETTTTEAEITTTTEAVTTEVSTTENTGNTISTRPTEESTTTTETTTTEATTYSLEKLEEMAIKDYEKKNGVRPDAAEATQNEDGTVTIVLTRNEDGKNVTVAVYTVDPATGKGTDKNGAEVNLPKTGNNALGTVGAVAGAFMLVGTGLFLTAKSGMTRRKEDEE